MIRHLLLYNNTFGRQISSLGKTHFYLIGKEIPKPVLCKWAILSPPIRLYNNVRRLNLYFPVYRKPLHIQLNKVYVNTVCSIQVTICVNISKTKYAKFHTKFRIYSVSVDFNEFLKAMQIILYNLNKLGKLIQTKHAQTCHGEKNIVKQHIKILEIYTNYAYFYIRSSGDSDYFWPSA